MGTLAMYNVLGMAARFNVPILQASTSEVYGDPQVHPQPESYWGHVNPIGPRACYDEGKRVAEALCIAYKNFSDVRIRIARIFNTYGPYMSINDGRVISNFCVQALTDKPLTVYGDGSQTRSFCHVDDLVNGLVLLMDSEIDFPVNLGNPEEYTMLELAEQILKLSDSKEGYILQDLPEDDPQKRCPDISLAIKELDWKPHIKLSEGLVSTMGWFERSLNE